MIVVGALALMLHCGSLPPTLPLEREAIMQAISPMMALSAYVAWHKLEDKPLGKALMAMAGHYDRAMGKDQEAILLLKQDVRLLEAIVKAFHYEELEPYIQELRQVIEPREL